MIFVITEIVCIPTGTSLVLRKKIGKESQYIVSHPELGSDPPFESDRELRCDTLGLGKLRKPDVERQAIRKPIGCKLRL